LEAEYLKVTENLRGGLRKRRPLSTGNLLALICGLYSPVAARKGFEKKNHRLKKKEGQRENHLKWSSHGEGEMSC